MNAGFLRKFVALAGVVLAVGIMSAGATAATQDFQTWLQQFREEALAADITPKTLDMALKDVRPIQKILDRDRNQAEDRETFVKYAGRRASRKTINRGLKLQAEHADLLAQVAKKYRVQPRFMLAIWGLETRYGSIRGKTPIIPALATLAYDVRRTSFFRNELLSALRMLDRGYIELANMTGSWAGAMGHPQFIPSSYLAYAADFNNDGRRDIWNDLGDVFASIANYLAKHSWSDDQTWGREVRLPADFDTRLKDLVPLRKSGCRAMKTMSAPLRLSKWQAMGVRRPDGSDLPTRDLPASLVRPDGADGPSFLVYKNYQSILRYNCSHKYALTIGRLADGLWRK